MIKNVICDYFQTDVLVIGGGLAGLMAARSIVLQKGKRLSVLTNGSGSSAYIHGINIPMHEKDSEVCFVNDTLKSGHYQGGEILVNELCKESISLISLFEEMGISLECEDEGYTLLRSLGSSWPRVVTAGNTTGIVIMKKITDELLNRENVKIHSTLRVLRLMVVDGAVHGALAYDTNKKTLVFIEVNVIIMATGGFCNIFPFSTNASDIAGDGIAMAYDAGVPLTDLEFVQFEPCAAIYPSKICGEIMITTMFYEGAVLRNYDGDRFMIKQNPSGEQVDKDVLARSIFQEIKNGNGTKHGGVYFDATGVGSRKLNESYPMYVKRYADCGIDITKQLVEVAPAPHTSLGGVVISADCTTSVSGLFACGEIVGGIHGANRIGGNASLETIVFGIRAGESAGAYLAKKMNMGISLITEESWRSWVNTVVCASEPVISNVVLNRKRMMSIRERKEKLLSVALNVIRSEKQLKPVVTELARAVAVLDRFITKNDEDELYMKLRLRNDLVVAYLLAFSAMKRAKTVGCHVRADTTICNDERYRIQVEKGSEGAVLKKISLD